MSEPQMRSVDSIEKLERVLRLRRKRSGWTTGEWEHVTLMAHVLWHKYRSDQKETKTFYSGEVVSVSSARRASRYRAPLKLSYL
jgi:hypothetical protein